MPLPWPFQAFASAFEVYVLDRKVDIIVSQLEDLTQANTDLLEATAEIPAELDRLVALLEAGQPVPQELVESIKSLSAGLAAVVPNPEPEPEPGE